MPESINRVWTPIPGTWSREFCLVSESVRVVRQLLFSRKTPYVYELQEWGHIEWHTRAEETNAHRAFNIANHYARQRQEESVTR